MPERFDRDVSLVVKAALNCARRHGAAQVGGEHLLVGIAEVPSRASSTLDGLGADPSRLADAVSRGAHDARLLAGLGIDLAAVQRQVGNRLSARWITRRPRFRSDVKQALQVSRHEARRLRTRRISGDHLMLGLLSSSVAARELLLALDIDPMDLRQRVLRALIDGG